MQKSHYQGHGRYGRSAGMQRKSNAYLAIIFSIIKNINIWKRFDLYIYYIFEQGDRDLKDGDVVRV